VLILVINNSFEGDACKKYVIDKYSAYNSELIILWMDELLHERKYIQNIANVLKQIKMIELIFIKRILTLYWFY